jgi:hypothetical protein
MEGNMRGPSSQDCQKSYAKTGIPSANMLAKKAAGVSLDWADSSSMNLGGAKLVQIRALPASPSTFPSTSAPGARA